MTKLAAAPNWLMEKIRQPHKNGQHKPANPIVKNTTGNTPYGQAALDDAIQEVSTAAEGERNNLHFKNCVACLELENGGELMPGSVEAALVPAAIAAGLPEKEVRRTFQSALEKAAGKARTAPQIDYEPAPPATNGHGPETAVNELEIPRPVPLIDIAIKDYPELQYLVDEFIPRGMFIALLGAPKRGKSFLALEFAKCVDLGITFLGKETTKAKGLIVAQEDGKRRIHRRVNQMPWVPQQAEILFKFPYLGSPGKNPIGPGLPVLRHLIEENFYDYVIFDTFLAGLGGVEINDNSRLKPITDELANIAHDLDCTILLIHHTRKSGDPDDIFNSAIGAQALRSSWDMAMAISRQIGEREALLHFESRDLEIPTITIRQKAGGPGWEKLGGEYEIQKHRARNKTLEAMHMHESHLDGLTQQQIAEATGLSISAVSNHLNQLEEIEKVYREPGKGLGGGGRTEDVWFIK